MDQANNAAVDSAPAQPEDYEAPTLTKLGSLENLTGGVAIDGSGGGTPWTTY